MGSLGPAVSVSMAKANGGTAGRGGQEQPGEPGGGRRLPDAAALPAVQEGGLRGDAGVARRLPAPRVRPPRRRRRRGQEEGRHGRLPLAQPVLTLHDDKPGKGKKSSSTEGQQHQHHVPMYEEDEIS
uniref:Uncharacterized protein n=1 Tax=Aegilops tauschii TaxID=37682 RepID=M8BY43_AEGTA